MQEKKRNKRGAHMDYIHAIITRLYVAFLSLLLQLDFIDEIRPLLFSASGQTKFLKSNQFNIKRSTVHFTFNSVLRY